MGAGMRVTDYFWDDGNVKSVPSRARTILAFLAAPLPIPFVFFLVFLLGSIFSETGNNSVKNGSSLVGLFMFSAYGIVIAYLFELTFGVATWIIFKRLGIRTTLAFAGAGAVMGWLITVFFTGRLADVSNPYFWIDLAAGICCTSLFRLVIFSGSPDAESN